MSNALIQAGAQPSGPSKWAPIFTNEFFSGLYTNRNPLRDPATPFLYNKFYSATRYEALWDGLNTEISPRLTLIRAPGHSVFNSNTFPACLDFYSYHVSGVNFSDFIRVMADTETALYEITNNQKTLIYTKSAGAGQTRFVSVGNTLYMGNGVDLLQLLTPSYVWAADSVLASGADIQDTNGNVQLSLGYATPCSSITISGGVLTASCSDLTNIIPGATVVLQGMTPDYLNGLSLTVLTSGSGVFTAAISAINLSPTAQTGWVVVPAVNGTTGSSQPTWSVTNLGLTLDGTNLWQNNGPVVRPWGITAPITAPTVSNNINTALASAWAADTYFWPVLPLIELSGFIYQLTIPGTTAGSVPTFDHTTPGSSTTTDGSATWLYLGVAARATSTAYAAGSVIFVTWSNTTTGPAPIIAYNHMGQPIYGPPTTVTTTYSAFFQCIVGGTSSAATDAQLGWGASLNSQVTDNDITWQNIGLAVTRTSGTTSSPVLVNLTLQAGVVGNSQAVQDVDAVLDSNGAVESVQTAGETGAAEPVWATAAGATTPEVNGTTPTGLVWTNIGNSPAVGGSAANPLAWIYTYAYKDGITGAVGPAAPVSASINLAADSYIQVQGQTTSQVGVTEILIFRSTGGQAVPFLIGTIDNTGVAGGIWTYNDLSPDQGNPGSTMNNLIEADLVGANSPPPTGFVPVVFHLSSIWGFVGSTLYYSYGGDVTDDLGGFEAFPGGNFIEFQSDGVVGWSTSNGLYVILNDSIQLIGGTVAPFSVSFVVPIGILSPNCFTLNGQTPFIYTSDRQLIGIDPSAGISVDGFPIANLLAAAPYSPTSAYLAWYVNGTDQRLFAADGSTGYFNMLNSIPPELPTAVWSPKRVISAGASAVKAVEVTPGEYRLLVGPNPDGPILYRDTTSATDNGVTYKAWAIVGSNVLCHPGQLAEIGFIHADSVRAGNAPLLSVLLDEIYGYPNCPIPDPLPRGTHDPPRLPPNRSTYSLRYYLTQTGNPAWCRHMQLMITFSNEDALSELLSFTMFGAIHVERVETGA